MLTFIAKTKKEAVEKISNNEWLEYAVEYLQEVKNNGCDGYDFSLGIALELFEISLDDEYIEYAEISGGFTPLTKKCKDMIAEAYAIVNK